MKLTAEAIRENLRRDFNVTPWTEGFFRRLLPKASSEGFFRSNEIPLNTFLEKLLCFDAAVLVLGADDMKVDRDDHDHKVHAPRDNVIFELGACMARLGTHRTFIVISEQTEVQLPSCFKGIYPLTYEVRKDGNDDVAAGGRARLPRPLTE